MKIRLWLTSLLLGVAAYLPAQTFNLQSSGVPAISLDGQWRFHTGDNPSWANPDFDDAHWPLLRSDQSWAGQGYQNYGGLAWYRFQVAIPPTFRKTALLLPSISTSYQVFADGKLLGTVGDMPPNTHPTTSGTDYHVFALPAQSPRPPAGQKIEIALRIWNDPTEASYSGGPDSGGGLVGESGLIRERQRLSLASSYWGQTGAQTLSLLQTLAGMGALILFLLRRKETEYLWFSLIMFFTASVSWLNVSLSTQAWNLNWANLIGVVSFTSAGLASIAFYQTLLQPSRFWLRRVAITAILIQAGVTLFTQAFPKAIGNWPHLLLIVLLTLPLQIWIAVILIDGLGRRSTDARLLIGPVFLVVSVDIFANAMSITNYLGWQHKMTNFIVLTETPFEIEIHQVTAALFLLGVFAILVLRFARVSTEQELYASEVEGARSVQQFLIPEDLPRIPGFAIESEYRPAREVGGDFFQIIPDLEDGSALVLVGDVAGKGMQAGMLATLLVGAMRTAATFTRDPAVILSTLNNRLHGKGNATCLALRIQSDGAATLVNAGHLPPYRNGIELPMEGALPLGTIPAIDFPVSLFQLAPGDSLMLISDGVLEAQRPDGELFGFERITAMLQQNASATTLADAAQSFGQSDDITVLTIARVAVPSLL